nr:uncharacterized protein LOC109187050 [Ipomoea batatas]
MMRADHVSSVGSATGDPSADINTPLCSLVFLLPAQFTNSGVSQLPDYQPELLSASPATPPLVFPASGSWNIYPKFVAKEINLTPQSSGIGPNYNGVPIYEKGEEYCSCALTLGQGSNGKGKEPINVSSMVGSSNNVVVQPSFFSLQLPSGDGGLGFTDDNINDIDNNVPGKNKRKRQYTHRKKSVYSFPTNVKNLLSTGIFEGVPVKYVSWSRGAVNAYEFEKHAGCDTKHPNNNIYFPSGKSLYSVVQELKLIRDFVRENSLEEIIIPTPLFVPIVSYRGIMFFLRHLYIGVPSKIFSCNPRFGPKGCIATISHPLP